MTALAVFFALASAARAEPPASVAGRWGLTVERFGVPSYGELLLTQEGDKVSGTMSGIAVAGAVAGGALHFASQDPQQPLSAEATVAHDRIEGAVTMTDGFFGQPTKYAFTAIHGGAVAAGSPRRHDFAPMVFHREFSGLAAPALHISPGDTVHTITIDAAGADETGRPRALGGNPQTGPFYVEGALPGDTLVVHIRRLRLNRDYAISDDGVVRRALDQDLAVQMKDGGKPVRWRLDRARGLAMLEKPGEHTAAFAVPVRPMLGCIATAPSPDSGSPPSRDSGAYGGNMDFNEIVEGSTVYLPVFTPGALLYFGDGHALQGDGEINGNALETSLDVEVTVDLVAQKRIPGPRVENDTHIMGMGLAGSVDDAYRAANANLAAWLSRDYHLTPAEVAEVMGAAVEYRISEVADRNAGVVAKLSKATLATLSRDAGEPKKP